MNLVFHISENGSEMVFIYLVQFLFLPCCFSITNCFQSPRKVVETINGISPEMKKSFSSRNISNCLLVVACLMGLSIPSLVYIGLALEKKESSLDNAELVALWARTTVSMN